MSSPGATSGAGLRLARQQEYGLESQAQASHSVASRADEEPFYSANTAHVLRAAFLTAQTHTHIHSCTIPFIYPVTFWSF